MVIFAIAVFVTVGCFVSLQNWRLGLVFACLLGIAQDPLRKVVPDTPAYLTLSFMPIIITMFARLWVEVDLLAQVRRYFPQAMAPAAFLSGSLLVSTAETISYSFQLMPLAALGLFSYVGGLPALFLGFNYLRQDYSRLDRVLLAFAAFTAIALVGVPLEHWHVDLGNRLLGTVGAEFEWRRWYSGENYVAMISGFYRSPEIMGWHAATMCVIAIFMMVRRPKAFFLWASMVVWGLFCVFLSGRRKMLFMILAFVGAFFLFMNRHRRGYALALFMCAAALAVFLITNLVSSNYLEGLTTGTSKVGDRLSLTLMEGPLWLIDIVGPFGFGVGTKTQGGQHMGELGIETPLVEGGFEKILVEIGVVGTACFVWFAFILARYTYRCMRASDASRLNGTCVAGLAAFLVANICSFTVAFQVYGDPFIVCAVGFAAGCLLADMRLEKVKPRLRTAGRLEIMPLSGCLR